MENKELSKKEVFGLLATSLVILSLTHSSQKITKESLKEIIGYFIKMKDEGIIDNKSFTDIIAFACSKYVENEVENRIGLSISKKFVTYFDKTLS